MATNSRQFLTRWICACLILVTSSAVFNYLADPYMLFDVPRVRGFNARKPAVDFQQRLIKAYDVFRSQPRTLVLGSSRVAIGIDSNYMTWPLQFQPVYNLGLAGGTPYMAYRYLQHVMARSPIKLVILGVEFQYAVDHPISRVGGFESRLLVAYDGGPNENYRREQVRDLVSATLSLDALLDSISTLAANVTEDSSDLLPGHWDFKLFRELSAERGPYPIFVAGALNNFHRYFRQKPDAHLINDDVEKILELCKARGVQVVVMINPSHAYELEMLNMLGQWESLEEWKRELTRLVSNYTRDVSRNGAVLWDFNDYDSFSTETVAADQRFPLRFFLDPSHYSTALGDEMLKSIFGKGSGEFGELLTPDNIDAHLEAIRNRRRDYRDAHPTEVSRIRRIYEAGISGCGCKEDHVRASNQ